MALHPCAECGAQISDKAIACPQCGAAPEKPKRFKWWLWVPLGLIGVFVVFGIVGASDPVIQAKLKDKNVIEYCWNQQKRPSVDPELARFMASACEKLEADYQRKWGSNP